MKEKAVVEGGVNTPFRIKLKCDGEEFSFSLKASELLDVYDEFAVNSIEELFLLRLMASHFSACADYSDGLGVRRAAGDIMVRSVCASKSPNINVW
jgi:hypothetical protein